MKVTAWRITKEKHAKAAFTGEGARLAGGRYNSTGKLLIYAAQSRSLAMLEMLIHLESAELLKKYVFFEIAIDDSFILDADPSCLAGKLESNASLENLRAIGDGWAFDGASAVLRMPSMLVPGEENFLLNPRHPDFRKLQIGRALPVGAA